MPFTKVLLRLGFVFLFVSVMSFSISYLTLNQEAKSNLFVETLTGIGLSPVFAGSKGKQIEIAEKTEIELGKARKIVVLSKTTAIEIKSSDGKKISARHFGQIDWRGSKEPGPEVAAIKTETFVDEIRISVNNLKDSTSYQDHSVLEVDIPRSFKGDLKIQSLSGEITAGSIIADNLRITSTSGDIKIKDIKATDVSLEATSGDLKIDNLAATKSLSSTTVSGDFEVESLSSKKIKLLTTSGSVKIPSLSGSFNIVTTSGDVKATINNVAADSNVETVSGDIVFGVKGKKEPKVVAETVSGEITSDFSSGKQSGPTIKVKTISGDAKIKREK